MKQNRETKNRPTHMWSIDIQQRHQEIQQGKSFRQIVLENWMSINI